MAAVAPRSDYRTEFKALTGGTKTDCFTVPTGFWWDVTALSVCASTGSAGTATIAIFDNSASTEFVLRYTDEVPATAALEYEGLPMHLEAGDIIRVTGANLQHVFCTYILGAPGGRA